MVPVEESTGVGVRARAEVAISFLYPFVLITKLRAVFLFYLPVSPLHTAKDLWIAGKNHGQAHISGPLAKTCVRFQLWRESQGLQLTCTVPLMLGPWMVQW
jgi:hypothetical protein